MSNTYVNKVVYGNTTIIDISDTTATAGDVASGKVFYRATGERVTGTASSGGTPAISIVDTADANGGDIRTITALDISDTTATAADVLNSKYFYTAAGVKTQGTATGGGTYQAKTNVNPTTSSQTITPDSGYDALSSVQINAMPSGSATAPASISGSSATVSTGTNTLTLSKTVSVTPSVSAGYVASGTAGNSSVSLTASVTTKAAATYHPSASDQTISASQYLTGAQTIKGVSITNLSAANIKSGVTIKVGDSTDDDCVTSVTGTYSGGTSATQHVIHFGFSDSTSSDVNVYYDDSILGTIITSYTPTTYSSKLVTLAQLDGVTWYEVAPIPLNTELIARNTIVNGYVVDEDDGEENASQWSCCSGFVAVDTTMTFSFIGYRWYSICFYDQNQTFISGISQMGNIAQSIDSNDYAHGEIDSTIMPSGTKWVRISSYPTSPSTSQLSLIRIA